MQVVLCILMAAGLNGLLGSSVELTGWKIPLADKVAGESHDAFSLMMRCLPGALTRV